MPIIPAYLQSCNKFVICYGDIIFPLMGTEFINNVFLRTGNKKSQRRDLALSRQEDYGHLSILYSGHLIKLAAFSTRLSPCSYTSL